jgi:hypothetical protein
MHLDSKCMSEAAEGVALEAPGTPRTAKCMQEGSKCMSEGSKGMQEVPKCMHLDTKCMSEASEGMSEGREGMPLIATGGRARGGPGLREAAAVAR